MRRLHPPRGSIIFDPRPVSGARAMCSWPARTCSQLPPVTCRHNHSSCRCQHNTQVLRTLRNGEPASTSASVYLDLAHRRSSIVTCNSPVDALNRINIRRPRHRPPAENIQAAPYFQQRPDRTTTERNRANGRQAWISYPPSASLGHGEGSTLAGKRWPIRRTARTTSAIPSRRPWGGGNRGGT